MRDALECFGTSRAFSLRLECLSCDSSTLTSFAEDAAMTKLRYCISSMGIAWLGSDFASCLEQHELYLRLAGTDSEWIICSNQWQECQCNNHVRLLACMILYVDFIIPMDSWTFCSNEIVLRPPFKIQMLRWGTAKRWKLISPKKVGALFSVKFLGQNPLKQF